MKLWIDDIRPAPIGYASVDTVNKAIGVISRFPIEMITLIDIDHDAGECAKDGGDYIKLLDWLEENHYDIPIHIHSMNPVGVANMRRIIERNGWKEI